MDNATTTSVPMKSRVLATRALIGAIAGIPMIAVSLVWAVGPFRGESVEPLQLAGWVLAWSVLAEGITAIIVARRAGVQLRSTGLLDGKGSSRKIEPDVDAALKARAPAWRAAHRFVRAAGLAALMAILVILAATVFGA